MPWQPGPEWSDPKVSDVDADSRLADRLHRLLCRLTARRGARLYAPAWTGSGATRKIAIGVVSCLLLAAGLSLPNPWRTADPEPSLLSSVQEDAPAPPSWAVPTSVADETERSSILAGLALPTRRPSPPFLREPEPTPTAGPRLDPLPNWVQSLRVATLWAQSSTGAAAALIVPEKSQLRVLGQVENGRLPVYYQESSRTGRKLGAWVDLGDVQPSDDPPRVMASSRGGPRPTPDISTPDKFIAAVADAAQESQLESKVPASVTIAQAILESDWGKSLLATKAHNYFGIKAISGPGPAGVIRMSTWEVLGGRNVTVQDGFKAYNNLYESVIDHGRFLTDNPRYAPAFKFVDNAVEFARQIHLAGYATDPAYTSKLVNLMNKFSLFQYDLVQGGVAPDPAAIQ